MDRVKNIADVSRRQNRHPLGKFVVGLYVCSTEDVPYLLECKGLSTLKMSVLGLYKRTVSVVVSVQ
jgi:hypothetical protein